MKKELVLPLIIFLVLAHFYYIPDVYGAVTINVVGDSIQVSGSGTVNLTNIYNDGSVNPDDLNETSPKVWLLNRTLEFLDSDVKLEITDEDCDELRINCYPTLQREIISNGRVDINNTKIYGWQAGAYDTDPTVRAKITTSGSSTKGFTADNSILAYLGNASKSDAINTLANNEAIHQQKLSSGYVIISNCTFHNMSGLWFWGNMNYLVIEDSSFTDISCNGTIYTQWVNQLTLSDLEFSNATCLYIYDSTFQDDPFHETKLITNLTFTDQWTTNQQIILLNRDYGLYFRNITINNCGNNSVLIEWANENLVFENFNMNHTGLANNQGFRVLVCDRLLIRDSTFREINRIYAPDSVRAEFDNVTVIGNYAGGIYQYGILGGQYSHIHDCSVYNVTATGINAKSHSLVENNYVEECDSGIAISGLVNNVTFRDNILSNMTYSSDAWSVGFKIGGSLAGKATDILIENNTIEGGNAGILVYRGVEDLVIRNNTISLMPWGTGGAYLPIGYSRPAGVSGWRNESDYRVLAGVFIARQWGVSWNWTRYGPYSTFENITFADNTYNGTYMQAYVWVGKTDAFEDNTITGRVDTSGFSGDYYRFEFTDSYYNGAIVYMNEDNPIYRYQRCNGSCLWGWPGIGAKPQKTNWFISLNYTHFNFTTGINTTTHSLYSRYRIDSNNVWYLRHIQPINQTRIFSLYDGNITNERTYALWTLTDNTLLTLKWTTNATKGETTTSRIYSASPDWVLFNGAENRTAWTWNPSQYRISIIWPYNSEVEIEIAWRIPLQPLLPLMFILGIFGLVSIIGGSIYTIDKIKKHDAYTGLTNGVIIVAFGISLFISWLWAGA